MAAESQDTYMEDVAKILQFGQEDDEVLDETLDETYLDNKNPVNREIKEWDTQPMEVAEFNEVHCENTYIDEQINESDLIINNPVECAEAFKEDGALGLFFQFVPPVFIHTYMRSATQAILDAKESICGKKVVLSVATMRCVIGLDIAMSLCNSTTMKELWSSKLFLGSSLFQECMSRDDFVMIRGSLRPYSNQCSSNPLDPLWSLRPAMQHVLHNFAKVAYIKGPIAHDEASCATKARTRASVYNPSKPDKFAIHFYALTGWHYVYTFSLWDNGLGNHTNLLPAKRFLKFFGELIASFNQLILNPKSSHATKNPCPVLAETATMLWVLMFGLLYRAMIGAGPTPREAKKTTRYMDNYYTCHALAKATLQHMDKIFRITGTVKLNLVDKINKVAITKALADMVDAERGHWILVCAYDPVVHPNKAEQAKHLRECNPSKTLICNTIGFTERYIELINGKFAVPSKNVGFIVYKDSKPVIFYTNDLSESPAKLFSTAEDEQAVRAVHGLASLYRWVGGFSMHKQKKFMVPAPIVAYNIFMNGVDRADQMRATNACRQKRSGWR